MTNEELRELMHDTWSFSRTDSEGVTTSRTFQSETWYSALQQFVNFLKQDFGLTDESVAINGSKHTGARKALEDTGWHGSLFYPEDTGGR